MKKIGWILKSSQVNSNPRLIKYPLYAEYGVGRIVTGDEYFVPAESGAGLRFIVPALFTDNYLRGPFDGPRWPVALFCILLEFWPFFV